MPEVDVEAGRRDFGVSDTTPRCNPVWAEQIALTYSELHHPAVESRQLMVLTGESGYPELTFLRPILVWRIQLTSPRDVRERVLIDAKSGHFLKRYPLAGDDFENSVTDHFLSAEVAAAHLKRQQQQPLPVDNSNLEPGWEAIQAHIGEIAQLAGLDSRSSVHIRFGGHMLAGFNRCVDGLEIIAGGKAIAGVTPSGDVFVQQARFADFEVPDLRPRCSPIWAERIAQLYCDFREPTVGHHQLVIIARGMDQHTFEFSHPLLAWRVHLRGGGEWQDLFVHARTGHYLLGYVVEPSNCWGTREIPHDHFLPR